MALGYNVVNADGQTGVLSIRETEKEFRVYVEFDDGSEDLKTYSRDDNENYILEDLELYHGYTIQKTAFQK
jgi:hypothetical protein